jgi:hypothetical protein
MRIAFQHSQYRVVYRLRDARMDIGRLRGGQDRKGEKNDKCR